MPPSGKGTQPHVGGGKLTLKSDMKLGKQKGMSKKSGLLSKKG